MTGDVVIVRMIRWSLICIYTCYISRKLEMYSTKQLRKVIKGEHDLGGGEEEKKSRRKKRKKIFLVDLHQPKKTKKLNSFEYIVLRMTCGANR